MAKSRHTPQYERLLKALREARRKAGITQVEAAQRLGRPQSFVAKIENGERRVDVVELAQICRVYDRGFVSFVRSLDL